jgi:hypothetical protein
MGLEDFCPGEVRFVDVAGASARREYERRRAQDGRRRHQNRRLFATLVVATPLVVFALVHLAAWALNHWFVSALTGTTPTQDALDAGTTNLLAVILAGAATLTVATDLWSPRRTTQSWRKGYEGEVLTGAHLAGLPDSFVVLHDLRLPGGRENIDHLVIGPTGVFTIETKHYSSDVTIRHGAARCAGRNMDKVVAQASRQADAIRTVVATPVHAVVCLQGASVVAGLFGKPVVHGVRFSNGARLAKLLTDGARSLGSAEVQALASTLRAHLRPAVPDAAPDVVPAARSCSCGAAQVSRRRRQSDGQPFWGCSRFPACRNTTAA